MSCEDTSTEGKKISIARGESRTITFTVRDRNNALVDLTGASVYFTVRNRIEDAANVIAKKNAAAGGDNAQAILLNQTTSKGKFNVFVLHEDTMNLDPEARYVYDAWLMMPVANYYQIVEAAEFDITPAITRF
jgi:hypothetical protein